MLSTVRSAVRGLASSQSGAAAIEYTILIAVISIVMIVALGVISGKIQIVLATAGNSMS